MENKTTEELKQIAKDRAFYPSEKRLSALKELEKRAALDKELEEMKLSIESSLGTHEKNNPYNLFSKNKNITDDKTAPVLYSQKAIYGFSFFFSVFVGAIFMAMNFNRLNKRKLSFIVIIIGILATILIGYIASLLETSYLIAVINGSFGVGLVEIFWNKYIGKEFKYRKRSIVVPLIICLVISTALIYLTIISMPK